MVVRKTSLSYIYYCAELLGVSSKCIYIESVWCTDDWYALNPESRVMSHSYWTQYFVRYSHAGYWYLWLYLHGTHSLKFWHTQAMRGGRTLRSHSYNHMATLACNKWRPFFWDADTRCNNVASTAENRTRNKIKVNVYKSMEMFLIGGLKKTRRLH
jgi:hypothetical protein